MNTHTRNHDGLTLPLFSSDDDNNSRAIFLIESNLESDCCRYGCFGLSVTVLVYTRWLLSTWQYLLFFFFFDCRLQRHRTHVHTHEGKLNLLDESKWKTLVHVIVIQKKFEKVNAEGRITVTKGLWNRTGKDFRFFCIHFLARSLTHSFPFDCKNWMRRMRGGRSVGRFRSIRRRRRCRCTWMEKRCWYTKLVSFVLGEFISFDFSFCLCICCWSFFDSFDSYEYSHFDTHTSTQTHNSLFYFYVFRRAVHVFHSVRRR